MQLGLNQGVVSKVLNQFHNDEHVKDKTNHIKIMDSKIFFKIAKKNSEMVLKSCN